MYRRIAADNLEDTSIPCSNASATDLTDVSHSEFLLDNTFTKDNNNISNSDISGVEVDNCFPLMGYLSLIKVQSINFGPY